MSISNRFLTYSELCKLFDQAYLSSDIENGSIVAVSESTSLSLLIDGNKKEGLSEEDLITNLSNIHQTTTAGTVWWLDLTSENLARQLLNIEFVEEYCNKQSNPYDLSKRISLFFDQTYSYWTENVYSEAFEND